MWKSPLTGLAAAAIAVATTGRPVIAQTPLTPSKPSLYFVGGTALPLSYLNKARTARLESGVALEGGVQVPILEGLGLLGYVQWERRVLSSRYGSPVTVYETFGGVDARYDWYNRRRLGSSVLSGLGLVAVRAWLSGEPTRISPFLRIGMELRYAVSPRLAGVAQATAAAFHIGGFPTTSVLGSYSHGQFDTGLVGGVVITL